MLEEVVSAICSQNPMTLCPFLLRTVENTAVYIILYLFIYINKSLCVCSVFAIQFQLCYEYGNLVDFL